MKHKKEYIKPESLIQRVFDEEALLQGGMGTKSGQQHQGFDAPPQTIIIEDDIEDEVEEQPFDLTKFKAWDDGPKEDEQTW